MKLTREDKGFLKRYCGCGWRDVRAIEKAVDSIKVYLENEPISMNRATSLVKRDQLLQCIEMACRNGSASAISRNGNSISFEMEKG